MTDGPDSVSAAMRLLKAVACELRDLAHDTTQFGETLSNNSKISSNDGSIQLLQKFDMFAQSLQAHAVLIDDLSGRLHTGSLELSELDNLLHHVPFFSVRERLRAVVNGVDVPPVVNGAQVDESSDDFWFLNE